MKRIFIIILFCFILWPMQTRAADLGNRLSGMILLNTEGNGEAWYVYPVNDKRYYLGRPDDAFKIMRQLGLGIKEIDFQKIAQAGMPVAGDLSLAQKLSGRIIIEVEKNGEAWYIYPKDLKKYYLGRPQDAFKIMRELSLGISRVNLSLIHKNELEESINQYSKYEHKKISTASGVYTVDLITIDSANPKLRVITDTANSARCEKNCLAKPLSSYVFSNNAFAGINGTYFCTSADCERNYYFFPVYNSTSGAMINDSQLKYWTTGPMMVFDINNKFYYFKDCRDFKSVADFENKYQVKIGAAIGNKPRLIEESLNYLIDWEVDKKQREVKTIRNAIGYKDNKIYLVAAHIATVPGLADVMQALGAEYALNLDGGGSSALFYNDEYMAGPGRDIPNAILFAEK